MARNRTEIKLEQTTAFMANETLAAAYGFVPGALFVDEFSIVSFENILFDLFSYFVYLLELLFDNHKTEVIDIIEQKMPHRPSWYRTKALAFQDGFALLLDTDKYNNYVIDPVTNEPVLATDEEIANSKVIKYAAVTKSGGQLFIKIATETAGVLAPIAPDVKTRFEAYVDDVADCGVKYLVVNHLPDRLILGMQLFINPLVLNQSGMNIRTATYPVEDAIKAYMKELPFNGELVLAHLVDKLQQVEGVVVPHIYNATFQAIDISTGLYKPWENIAVKTVPVAGYFTVGSIDESSGAFENGNFSSLSYVV